MHNILDTLAKKTTEHEYYTPVPEGYVRGKTKYVVVFGTVMSGLGKGIFSSCLAKLLQDKGLVCEPIKFDGYLNQDAGTLNPYRHGEVFVLDDGTETDMDLGTYERMQNKNLSADNYLTGGRVFAKVLAKERKGEYLGRDVQIIPHITGEIKGFIRTTAVKKKADVVLIEVGGTVGDFENSYFIEAMRELAYEEGKENVCFVCMTYIMEPATLGEQKSKAAQLGLRGLLASGIQPDIVACRAERKVGDKIREKISLFSNVPVEHVVSVPDMESIYFIPDTLKESALDDLCVSVLCLEKKVDKKDEQQATKEWQDFVQKLRGARKKITIGITGKYTVLRDAYASVMKALEHAAAYNNVQVQIKWIETTDIEKGKLSVEEAMADVVGVIVPGGFGSRGAEGKIQCIRYLRENNIPYLGLCYGFQLALVEFARDVCGMKEANTTENDPKTKFPVIDYLPEQMKIVGLGGNMRLGGYNAELKKGTKVWELYGKKETVRERHRHRYEANPVFLQQLEEKGIIFSGKCGDLIEYLELPPHPFFVGTQSHPEFTSRPLSPNPLYVGFVRAAVDTKRLR
ncbi:CTP synthase [Candidatus Woesearchaeota archaeon]|nr:CTP synthase [Candidatus Woesearchaeota archaeon]